MIHLDLARPVPNYFGDNESKRRYNVASLEGIL